MDSLVACEWPHTYDQLAKMQQVREAEVSGGLCEQETEEGRRVETAMTDMLAPVVLDVYTLTLLAQQYLYKTRKRDVLQCVFILFYCTLFAYFPSKDSEPTSDVTSPHLQPICHSYLYLPVQCLRSIYMSCTKLTHFSAPLDSLISQSKYRNCSAIFKHEATLPLIVFLT